MNVIFDGIVMLVREEHLSKAPMYNPVTPFGIIILVKLLQFLKAPLPREVTFVIERLSILIHPEKASFPIEVNVVGKLMVFILEQSLNALLPILVKLLDKFMLFIE